jgi:hypothetical protein
MTPRVGAEPLVEEPVGRKGTVSLLAGAGFGTFRWLAGGGPAFTAGSGPTRYNPAVDRVRASIDGRRDNVQLLTLSAFFLAPSEVDLNFIDVHASPLSPCR